MLGKWNIQKDFFILLWIERIPNITFIFESCSIIGLIEY